MGPDKMAYLQSKCARYRTEVNRLTEALAEKNMLIRKLNEDMAKEEARVTDLEEAARLLREALEWLYGKSLGARALAEDVGKVRIANMWSKACILMEGKS
jgi:hypothetical protein